MLHIYSIKPLFTAVVTTGDRYAEDMRTKGIVTANKGDLKLYQKVIAVGSSVRDIKPGDMVMINPINYAVRKFSKDSLQNDLDNNPVTSYKFNWVSLDDENGNSQDCLLLNDRDILYIFEGEEINEPLIVSKKPEIITS